MARDDHDEENALADEGWSGPELGTELEGRYRLTDVLGRGGIGVVYKAIHLRLERGVAVKVLQEPFTASGMMRARFDREAKALAELNHPNIVAVSDYGVADNFPYIVMELLEGETLRELIDGEGRQSEEQALNITHQILSGLSYAHQSGFIHRDLKPGNVFLTIDESIENEEKLRVKILDFGFVKQWHDSATTDINELTQSGVAMGTIGYIPPEQLSGAETGPFSDVYTVGILLYEMLSGVKPFDGDALEIARKHLAEPVPPLSFHCPSIKATRELTAVLCRALAKKPEDRFSDAAEFIEALKGLPRPIIVPNPSGTAPTLPAVSTAAPPIPAGQDEQKTPAEETSNIQTPPQMTHRRRLLRRIGTTLFLLGLGATLALWWSEATNHSDHTVQDAGLAILEPNQKTTSQSQRGRRDASQEPDSSSDSSTMVFDQAEVGSEWEYSEDALMIDELLPEIVQDAEASHEAYDADISEEIPPQFTEEDAAPMQIPGVEDETPPAMSEPETLPIPRPEIETPPPTKNEPATTPPGATRVNPWEQGALPRFLAFSRRRVLRGGIIGKNSTQLIREYAQTHRDDPRPHLVLAQSFMNKRSPAGAIERYELAYHFNTSAAGDPRMLPDLVRLINSDLAAERATNLLLRAYGTDALPEIEKALGQRRTSMKTTQRLRRLKARLLQNIKRR